MHACGSLRRGLRGGPIANSEKWQEPAYRRPALQILITARLMYDLNVRPPKEKSRFLTPPKCGGFGMTPRNSVIPGIRMFRFGGGRRILGLSSNPRGQPCAEYS